MYHHYLTFWHWSGVTPYTSSCEFARSCVFDKQLAGLLSLRPSFRRNWASLIPKLRLLFCRVPWGIITRSPWSSRPDYLCWFTVRIPYNWSLEAFLGRLFARISQPEGRDLVYLRNSILKSVSRIYLRNNSQNKQHKSNNVLLLVSSVTPSHCMEVTEY